MKNYDTLSLIEGIYVKNVNFAQGILILLSHVRIDAWIVHIGFFGFVGPLFSSFFPTFKAFG